MMDIDIDDASSRSDSPYHDASDLQRPSAAQEPSTSQQPAPSVSMHPSSSSGVRSNINRSASAQQSTYSDQHIGIVLNEHPDWIPIIQADINYMERQLSASCAPQYFSDAYLSAIPRKRRRLLTATPDSVLVLQPSPSEAISNLLRRAVNSSSVRVNAQSLEPILSSIAEDAQLQEAYEDHVKSEVEARLKSDEDYNPEKFENSNKYFSP